MPNALIRPVTGPTCYSYPLEGTSPKWCSAFAHGCHGRVVTDQTLRDGDVALFGSRHLFNLLREAQQKGRTWFYGDHAYFGRGRYYRVTKNGYQVTGRGKAAPGRWHALGLGIAPWRRSGRHVLVCPQTPPYMAFFGLDADQWVADVSATLRQHTDREIRVRWKKDIHEKERPIALDLVDCWAIVAFSSAALLDGLRAGIPIFPQTPWCAGAHLGLADLSKIESPIYPEGREACFAVLAAHQWTLTELKRGMAWEFFRRAA